MKFASLVPLGRRVILLLSGLLIHQLALGETPVPSYTVIVGIDRYADDVILPRAFAEADAVALYRWLRDDQGGRVPEERIRLLLGQAARQQGALTASRENILQALRWALEQAQEDDLVLLAWFGQGAPVGDRTCYFAVDSSFKDRGKTAISASELEQLLERSKSARIVALLDVNFRGYDESKEKVSTVGLEKRFQEFDRVSDDQDERPRVLPPVAVLSANDGTQPSPENKRTGHGVFLEVVLNALNGGADAEGDAADGLITVSELFQYVQREYPQRTKQVTGKALSTLATFTHGHVPVASYAAQYRKTLARIEAFLKRALADKLPQEVISEGKSLIGQTPRFELPRQMRKHYLAYAEGKIAADKLLAERNSYLQSLQVSQQEAELFADRVLRVANVARANYFKPITYADLIPPAIRGLYTYMQEKVPPEINRRLESVVKMTVPEIRDLLVEVRLKIGQRDDIKGNKAAYRACDAMLHSLDNYSAFIEPEVVAEIERQTQQVFIGVGVQIQKDLGTDMVRVITPLRNSPAYKAGIQTGDLIVGVTNFVDSEGKPLKEPEYISTKGMSIREVVNKILGKEGTEVQLHLEREMANGEKKSLTIRLKRSRIEVETVFGVRRRDDDSWDYYIDPQNKIAYIRLSQFARFTARDLQKALEELSGSGLNGLILDLRFNPGGYLDQAVKIADMFIDDGVIVTVRPRRGREISYSGEHQGSYLNFPMVVLINGGSASASEIVSAALQDHGRAVIMGERSFGKASVQTVTPLQLDPKEGPAEVKLTTASFWRPNGKNLARDRNSKEEDDWGVRPHPDYTLKLEPGERGQLFEHLRRSEIIQPREPVKIEPPEPFTDRQLQMAVEFLRRQVAAHPRKPAPN
ncbi:MAG: S41 family peptidase [Gemmatales bacterium]|nr:S41 family peptidase [Candidatus Kapabacteria bacterium]MDW7993052.1 S41 family peptidase [Gemmatales bacterium]